MVLLAACGSGGGADSIDSMDSTPPDEPRVGCEDEDNWICSSGSSGQCLARCGTQVAIQCSGGECSAGYGSHYTDCGGSPSGQGCELCVGAINGICGDLVDP